MYELGPQFKIDDTGLLANDESVVKGSCFRITVLTERLLRLEYNKKGLFNDDATQLVVFRKFPVPKFLKREDEHVLEISTTYFTLSYQKEQPFKSSIMNASKNLFVRLNGTDSMWYYGHKEVKNFYGSNTLLENNNNTEINKGLYSLDGFRAIDDSKSLRFNKSGTIKEFVQDEEEIDIYLFMYNKDFGFCMKDYFTLTGYPTLIPRYVLGNWWCKNYPYNSKELLELSSRFNDKDMSISVILFDKDWHIKNYNKKELVESGFTFDQYLINNPKELIDSLHQKGIRVGVSINPEDGIYPNETFYKQAREYLGVPDGEVIHIDPKNPRSLDVYLKVIIHPLESYGVDFFWNEFSNQKDLQTLWIYNHYHYLDLARNPAKRGMLLSRNALVASHRYPVLYSGKTKVTWDNFKSIPFFNISASNIGVCWWSNDVGGYSGGIEESELYIRSVQLGTFSPILRFHTDKGKYYKREPWKWDKKTYDITADYLKLRHELTSYLYTEAYRYSSEGRLIFQPLYYYCPGAYDDIVYRNEYFFGSNMFVAPIVNKKEPIINRTIHRMFLPEGIWYDFFTGKKFIGNKKYVAFFKEEDYPVFVKRNSIIPLSKKSNVNNTSNPTDLEIQIFPGDNSSYTLYEDDGISSLYKEDYFLKTLIEFNRNPNSFSVIIKSLEGKNGIVPDKRNYQVVFRNTKEPEETKVRFNDYDVKCETYTKNGDLVVKIDDVYSIGQLTISCKGEQEESDPVRLINDDIASILSDLLIQTELKEKIDEALFSDAPIKEKRISIRKLKRDGLDSSFVKLFLNLLEYIDEI